MASKNKVKKSSSPAKKSASHTAPKAAKKSSKPAEKAQHKGAKSASSKAAAKPAVKPAAAAALAPPVAAALKPALPKQDGPPSDPVPSAPSQTQALPAPANTIITTAAIDVSAVKRAVEMVRNRKHSDAGEVKKNISDPVAKKLVEWVILRSDDSGADFARYTAFITANPNWPSIATLRRKAEAVAY